MNKLDAFKMDGLGNDFIIFDGRTKNISLTKKQIIKIADRNNVGCDQVILINNDKTKDAYLTFFNPDGEEIGACGNGSRCVAYLLMKEKNTKKITLRTKDRFLDAKLVNKLVCINMGSPIFDWEKIPLSNKMDNKNLKIEINNKIEDAFSLNVGNPHMVFFVNNLNEYRLEKIGPKLENHKYFPKKCNVTFANIINKNHIKVKVWERGAGITKACGTAACATLVAACNLKLTNRYADIEFDQGSLKIDWNLNNNIYMTGKVSKIKKISVAI